MNMNEWKASVLDNPKKVGMPLLSWPSIQLLGISVKELIYDSDLIVKGMEMVAKRCHALASFTMMDLSVEAECFGSAVSFYDIAVPVPGAPIVHNIEEAIALDVPKVGSYRTMTYLNAARKAKEVITDRPVFANVIGPYSLAATLLGMDAMMVATINNPEMVLIVLEKCTKFILEYAKAYKNCGADGVVIADPTTSLISPKLAKKFAFPFAKEVINGVQDDTFLCIYHNCAKGVLKMPQEIADLHAAGYNFGEAIELSEMIPQLPEDSLILGNIDPSARFALGDVDSMIETTKSLMESCGKYKNFVPASGCDCPANSQWENIDAFFQTVDRF